MWVGTRTCILFWNLYGISLYLLCLISKLNVIIRKRELFSLLSVCSASHQFQQKPLMTLAINWSCQPCLTFWHHKVVFLQSLKPFFMTDQIAWDTFGPNIIPLKLFYFHEELIFNWAVHFSSSQYSPAHSVLYSVQPAFIHSLKRKKEKKESNSRPHLVVAA